MRRRGEKNPVQPIITMQGQGVLPKQHVHYAIAGIQDNADEKLGCEMRFPWQSMGRTP